MAVNAALLIDAIVRQTVVLIATLATGAGQRASLSHVADQVFTDLTTTEERALLEGGDSGELKAGSLTLGEGPALPPVEDPDAY
jgi:hypothetical protein